MPRRSIQPLNRRPDYLPESQDELIQHYTLNDTDLA
jgi:hypothetical protein